MALAEPQPVRAFTHACLYARIKMATAGNGTARSGAYITGQPARLKTPRDCRGASRGGDTRRGFGPATVD